MKTAPIKTSLKQEKKGSLDSMQPTQTYCEYFKKNFPAPLLENALAYTSLGGELKPDKQSKLDRFLLKAFIEANRENEDFVMPTIYTEEIGRLADKIKAHIG